MTELTVTRDPANKRAFVLETVGRAVMVPKKLAGTIILEVPDAAAWTLDIHVKPHPVFTAVEEGHGTAAVYDKRQRRFSRNDRELTLTQRKHGWIKAGRWILSEGGIEIATFPHREWGIGKLKVAVVDEQAFRRDPRLALFAAWVAQRISASGIL
jgi:hypothetical protein